MKNNNLKPVNLPMKIRFGEKPTTKFIDTSEAIKINILRCPTSEELKRYLPMWTNATWMDQISDTFTKEQRHFNLLEVLNFKTLPSALETIEIIFSIEGITTQEVTHLLRHRAFSFSAQCTGDRWQTHESSIIPSSIANSEFADRYKKHIEDSKQLYVDMIDSKEISIMDARYVLPRSLTNFYFVKANLKDLIGFIHQRIDRQIQPEADNIIAYRLIEGLLDFIPELAVTIDLDEVNKFYVATARTGKGTNLYFPEDQNDIFEWNENDFIYKHKRKNGKIFIDIYNTVKLKLKNKKNEITTK